MKSFDTTTCFKTAPIALMTSPSMISPSSSTICSTSNNFTQVSTFASWSALALDSFPSSRSSVTSLWSLMCIWYLCDLQQCKDIPVTDIFNMATNTISYSTWFPYSSSLSWLSIFSVTCSHERIPSSREIYSPILHGEDLHNQNLRLSFIIFPGHKCSESPLLFPWWSQTTLEPKSHVVSSLVIFSVWAFPSSHFKLPLSPL